MNSTNMVKWLADGPDPTTSLLVSVQNNHFAWEAKLHLDEDPLKPLTFEALCVPRQKHRSSMCMPLKWQLNVWERLQSSKHSGLALHAP